MNSAALSRFLFLLALICAVFLFPSGSFALPPTLSGVVVEPSVLSVGSGIRAITISVLAFDPDGDLKNVKVQLRRKGLPKQTFKLTDDGTGGDAVAEDGRFTTRLVLDTARTENVALRIQAKDQAKNRSRQGQIVSIVNTAVAPVLDALTVTPSVLEPQGGNQVVMISVRVLDPNGDLRNVKLDRLIAPGARKKAEKFGRLLDDGTRGDIIAGDGVYTTRVSFNPLDSTLIPLQVRAKDLAKNKVAVEFDLRVGTRAEPLVSAEIADTNDDGRIDGLDIPVLMSRLGTRLGERGYFESLDIVPDGVINMLDVDMIQSNFGVTDVPTFTPGESGTVFRGRVLDGLGLPLSGVMVRLGRTGFLAAETNVSGLFRIVAPSTELGETVVTFDAKNARDISTNDGLSGKFPTLTDLPVFINGGADNIFRDISLPELNLNGAVDLNNAFDSVASIGNNAFQVKFGEALIVQNNGVELRFSEGCSLTFPLTIAPELSVTQISPAMLPAVFPPGKSSTLFGAVNPGQASVNCPVGSQFGIVFDNPDRLNVSDVPVLHGIVDGILQPLGGLCGVVDVDTDAEVNDVDDRIQCGPIPTPLQLGWYSAGIIASPCPRTTVVGTVRSEGTVSGPIGGISVTMPGASPVVTAEDGSFTIPNVPAGPNGILCESNSFPVRVSVSDGDVANSSQSVQAVPGGITNLGEITLGDDITVTLISNGIVFLDDTQAQFAPVLAIAEGAENTTAIMSTPPLPLASSSAKVLLNFARDQGVGTRTGTVSFEMASRVSGGELVARFSPVTFATTVDSVFIDLSQTTIDFFGKDPARPAGQALAPLPNDAVLTLGASPGSLVFDPNAFAPILLQAGIEPFDAVSEGFVYVIRTPGISTRLALGPDTCPQTASPCTEVTLITGETAAVSTVIPDTVEDAAVPATN